MKHSSMLRLNPSDPDPVNSKPNPKTRDLPAQPKYLSASLTCASPNPSTAAQDSCLHSLTAATPDCVYGGWGGGGTASLFPLRPVFTGMQRRASSDLSQHNTLVIACAWAGWLFVLLSLVQRHGEKSNSVCHVGVLGLPNCHASACR